MQSLQRLTQNYNFASGKCLLHARTQPTNQTNRHKLDIHVHSKDIEATSALAHPQTDTKPLR